MSDVFPEGRLPGVIFIEIDDKDKDWTQMEKTMHVGRPIADSIHSYNNIIIKTLPSATHKSKIEVDLTDVEPTDGNLSLKLRKVKVCDGNGNNGEIYVLCSEVFGTDSGFNTGDGLMAP